MTFIECEIFRNKRMSLTFYESLPADFIYNESW
jgi:hypothetical protein